MTGGDGFVGQHLVAHLLERGCDVTATHLAETPAPGTLADSARAAAAWQRLDVRDAAGVASVVRAARPRRIFHLAGYSSSAEARARPVDALEVNGAGTLRVAEAAARARPGVELIVVAGSAEAYGHRAADPVDERAPLRPAGVYGATKAAQDVIARGAGRALGVRVLVARLFPLIGPGQRGAFALPSFCRRALAIRRADAAPRLAVGNLDVVRDFTDVRDGVRALTALAGLDRPAHGAYNVCSGRGTPVRRLLQWVIEAAGIEPEIVTDPELVRPDEPETVIGDAGRLRRETGWRPGRDLRACVRDTFDWAATPGPGRPAAAGGDKAPGRNGDPPKPEMR